ncbi:dihydrofolate reductase family protein [Curtobacterium flaccumfaciens]|nr:dihydrofolate reductase family protein [Curtobacterium flaccumfaciens]
MSLDPASRVFTAAPVRPIVLTSSSAAGSSRTTALSSVAEVVACSDPAHPDDLEPARVRDELVARGFGTIHCEGGPTLFGSLVAADLVDELTLTIDPTLEGGAGPRITGGPRRRGGCARRTSSEGLGACC